jgi:hypothetical protein
VLPAIMVMTIWKEAGFFMIFYLAAMQNIPPELEGSFAAGGSRPLVLLSPGDVPPAHAHHTCSC